LAFLALLAFAFTLYLGVLLVLRSGAGHVRLVCAIAAVIQLIPLAGPLLLSRDAYSYWAYGRIAAHSRNPYAIAPARFPGDPSTRAVARAWRERTSVYGPAFTTASVGVGDIAGNSAELAALLFRVVAALAAIGATLLAATIARRKTFAAAFLGWNPLIAVSFAGGGHNDAWMVVLMLAGVALVARRRDAAGGAMWILAAAIKAPAFFLLPLQLLRSRRGVWVGAVIAGLSIAALATTAFGTSWLTSLIQVGRQQSRFSLPARLEQLGVPGTASHALADIVLAAGALWLGRQALRGRARLALGASLLLLTSPWVLPWYATWPVALAAFEEDEAGQIVALAVAAYLLPARIPL
jgi:Glycosyltransferase family 87